jgi:hypothetical protein
MKTALRPWRRISGRAIRGPAAGPTNAICAERSGGRSGAARAQAASASAAEAPP